MEIAEEAASMCLDNAALADSADGGNTLDLAVLDTNYTGGLTVRFNPDATGSWGGKG